MKTEFEVHNSHPLTRTTILIRQIPTNPAVLNWLEAILFEKLSNKVYIFFFAKNVIQTGLRTSWRMQIL